MNVLWNILACITLLALVLGVAYFFVWTSKLRSRYRLERAGMSKESAKKMVDDFYREAGF